MSKLKTARTKNKMSQEELALESQVPLRVIKRIEADFTEPTLDELKKLSTTLKVDQKKLLNEKTSKKIMTVQLYDEIIRTIIIVGIVLGIANSNLWLGLLFVIVFPIIVYLIKYFDIKKVFGLDGYDFKSDIYYVFLSRIVLNTEATKDAKKERKFYYKIVSLIYSSLTTLVAIIILADAQILTQLGTLTTIIYIIAVLILLYLTIYLFSYLMFEYASKKSNRLLKKSPKK